jgi:excisionase family DNA binding protein
VRGIRWPGYALLTALIKVSSLAPVAPRTSSEKPSNFITIKQAALLLGVSEPTLRRWDASGKFTAKRHPINGYRLYDRKRVVGLRAKIDRGVGR